jgi:trans-2,3-dihydro-3-hydroxyanthranilate isomerase
MEKLTFYIVDVFAEEKYAGNQLAVFRNGASLSTQQMQRIAKEINYSETTFIVSEEMRDGGYDVRIFTPSQELPFAGHPTLGTAFILQQVIEQPVGSVTLNLKVGQIPVTLSYIDGTIDLLWMRQNPPTFGRTFDAATIAPILNLDPSDLDDRYPIQEVSTGLPFFIVPLKNQRSLKQAKTNRDRLFELIKTTDAKAMLIFCPETYHSVNQLSVRVFVDAMGIPEDPATGSANGCLAGYLANYDYFGDPLQVTRRDHPFEIRVEQGYEIGRPSLLFLKAQKLGDQIEVSVGGQVVLVARGEFV